MRLLAKWVHRITDGRSIGIRGRTRARLHDAARWCFSGNHRHRIRMRRRSIRAFETRMRAHGLQRVSGLWRADSGLLTPEDVKSANLRVVTQALRQAGVDYFWVRNSVRRKHTIAVLKSSKGACLAALGECGDALDSGPLYVHHARTRSRNEAVFPLSALAYEESSAIPDVITVAGFYSKSTSFGYGVGYGCDLEFWDEDQHHAYAPRRNSASNQMAKDALRKAVTIDIGGETIPTIRTFLRPGMAEPTFPIDVVYTWVDDADPVWLEKMELFKARRDGTSYHRLAHHAARFRTRDELKYSLRSLAMYAPWVRDVYLVTDNQIPQWLNPEAKGLHVVSHEDIWDDPSKLPVFNSNAIISQLFRIPGLSEHYLYLNDDVFIGRPVSPEMFFTSGGLARVFPSTNQRPIADPSVDQEPHFNLTTNIRRMIARDFACNISQAIKHTPHPQLRSVHEQLAHRYREDYERTSRSRFRHHDDFAADQLFHYYAQLTGRAVPGRIRYHYANIGDRSYEPVLQHLLRRRDRDVFCLNDAPDDNISPIDEEQVANFLEEYFPLPSPYEKVWTAVQASGRHINTPVHNRGAK